MKKQGQENELEKNVVNLYSYFRKKVNDYSWLFLTEGKVALLTQVYLFPFLK
jgi:hypothetical protein